MHISVFLGESPETLAALKIYDSHKIDSLPLDLEELASHMARLLSRYGVPSTGITLKESIKLAALISEGWPEGKPNTRLSYTASAQLGDGLHLFAFGNEDEGGSETPEIRPSRNVVPLEIVSSGVSFGGALMRLIEVEDGRLVFSTEHRNYPFVFRLKVAGEGGQSILELGFDADKSNVPQALEFSALVGALESSKSVKLLGSSDEVADLTIHG